MGSTFNYNSARIESHIDAVLVGVIRSIILVFFLFVTLTSFVFAVTLTAICLFAAGLRLMLHFVARRPETQRLFALAGC